VSGAGSGGGGGGGGRPGTVRRGFSCAMPQPTDGVAYARGLCSPALSVGRDSSPGTYAPPVVGDRVTHRAEKRERGCTRDYCIPVALAASFSYSPPLLAPPAAPAACRACPSRERIKVTAARGFGAFFPLASRVPSPSLPFPPLLRGKGQARWPRIEPRDRNANATRVRHCDRRHRRRGESHAIIRAT